MIVRQVAHDLPSGVSAATDCSTPAVADSTVDRGVMDSALSRSVPGRRWRSILVRAGRGSRPRRAYRQICFRWAEVMWRRARRRRDVGSVDRRDAGGHNGTASRKTVRPRSQRRLAKPSGRLDVAPAYQNAMGDGPRDEPPSISALRSTSIPAKGFWCSRCKKGSILWKHAARRIRGQAFGVRHGMLAARGERRWSSPPVCLEHCLWPSTARPASCSGKLTVKTRQVIRHQLSSPPTRRVNWWSLLAHRQSGSTLRQGVAVWRYPFKTDYNCNTATPISVNENILISSGENHGACSLSVQGGEVSEVWTSLGVKSTLRSEWQTPVKLGDYLYGFDNVGSAGPVTHLTCVDSRTGEQVWRQPRFGKGNLIAADGKLWCTLMTGELVVVKATPEAYQELARAEVVGETRQIPALSNGRLFLRDGNEIVCVDLRPTP